MSSAGAGLPGTDRFAPPAFGDIAFVEAFAEAEDFALACAATPTVEPALDWASRFGFTDFDAFVVVATAVDAVTFVLLARVPPVALPVARAPGARMVLLDIGPLLDQLPR